MRRRAAILAILSLLVAALFTGGPLSAQTPSGFEARELPDRLSRSVSDEFRVKSLDDIVQVFIRFDEPAVAEVAADGAGSSAQKQQGQRVLAQQASMKSVLGSKIVEELSSMQVAANGIRVMVKARDIPSIRATDGVLSVGPVVRYHLLNETSVPWIGTDAVHTAGFTGDGITIAVIDTGIDYTHASFGGPGTEEAYDTNSTGVIEPGTFPTAKVIGGFDFAGPVYNASDPDLDTPSPDADPLDVHGHGTHVAGTAAGIDGIIDVGHGVAPDALLYAFKVFGDVAGSTDLVSDALERSLDPNNDLSTDDHVDIVNMSLGSDFGHPDDPSAIATQNAVDLGIVVVAASGNAGDVPYITGSPAVAADAISVAASIDGGFSVNAITVNSPVSIADDYEAAIGDFGTPDPDITADMEQADPLLACSPLTNDLTGMIAFIQRGTCAFSMKIRHAEDAGAVGVVVMNNVAGAPFTMGQDGTPDQPEIPAMMVSLDDGNTILSGFADPPVNVTLSDDIVIPKPELADTMASFSSRGPGFGSTFKPDISAPGFGILSAGVGTGDGPANSSGTSMATPHVAGAAALLLEAYPDLTSAEVKAMLMNSARPAEPDDGSVAIARQGTGVVQIDRAALDVGGYAMPSGISFGRVNPTTAGSDTETVDVTRFSGDATYDVDVVVNQSMAGVTLEASSATVTTSGSEGSVDVTLSWNPAAMDPDDGFMSQSEIDGWLVITNQANPDDTMVVGLMAVLDPASIVAATGGEEIVSLANTGPADGWAEGYTLLAEGSGATGSVDAVGFRTHGGGSILEIGLAADMWNHPSVTEVDIFLDVDQDGSDDWVIVAADLGLLTGTGAFNGQWVTALFDLVNGGGFLQYFAVADLNDGVAGLFADVTGAFGFNPGTDTWDVDVLVWDLREGLLTGIIEDLTIDLDAEITSTAGLSFAIPAGVAGDIPIDGEGDMLWLFANNTVGNQVDVVEVTTPAPPPPPPPPPPAATNVAAVGTATGFWELYDGGTLADSFFYGNPGDFPFMGDWNCNGVDTPGLYRQSDGFVYLRNSNTQGIADITFFFGNPGDVPIVGDFNGNGCDTVSIYRPSEARFYIINKLGTNGGGLGAADFSFLFGNVGDVPFVGDWNGNGMDTPGLRRPSDGFVYLRNTNTQGVANISFFYGNPGDVVFAGDWDGNGSDSIGLYRPSNGTIFLRNALSTGIADTSFVVGTGRLPAAGDF